MMCAAIVPLIASRSGSLATVVRAEPLSTLPSREQAKQLLDTTHRHREWLTVPIAGNTSVLAWAMYPERVDRAPVVMLTGDDLRADVWTRAISDQLAAEGYVVVVPDVLTEVDTTGRLADAPAAVGSTLTFNNLKHGLIRVTLRLPDNMDVIDFAGNVITNASRTIDVWRGVPTIENSVVSAPYQADGRFATLEQQALGALQAIRDAGLKPGSDIAVAGFDDLEAAALAHPPLTTIRQDRDELGAIAAARAVELIDDPEAAPADKILPVELVVRASTTTATA